ncbi:hypothetical protein DQ04_09981010 [Trypanosoma grayi]|uniref:hypothetical protein n=1 Tax=Trypanosoma grayi TaxID=71804 RepID=UPI0004F47E31|nr:hypothetical protein DQ04_09981010 [Trypanosoma grayi]KEG07380.1 hypothetical protein DQ04_09981010 [Trypanosoma grayi]
MMNTIMWAERLNRTAVFGWFYAKKNYTPLRTLYDFSEIARRYCVVSYTTMRSRLARTGALRGASVGCYGLRQCLVPKTVRKVAKGMTLVRDVDTYLYAGPNEINIVRDRAVPQLMAANETLVVVGAATAFFLCRGLADHAAIYGLLRPSAFVERKVTEFLDRFFTPRNHFFAVHLRHREGSCPREIARKLVPLGAAFKKSMDVERLQLLYLQCNASIPYLAALHASLGLRLFSFPLFVAHDGQDPHMLPLLTSRGARVYDAQHYDKFEDCDYGLCALTVDYFLMMSGVYFSGNSISSVSQNVCFARLGRGQASHGMDPEYIRMVSHDVMDTSTLPA